MKGPSILLVACLVVILWAEEASALDDKKSTHKKVKYSSKPNFIVFFVDDLGWGDLPVYGHPINYAPNIQLMTKYGLLFTEFYTTSPACSPSRAALLTGRYQIRSGIYQGVFAPNDVGGLPHEEVTIAEGLKEVGYRTGIVGKWHLGVGEDGQYLPTKHGFDYYLGIPYTHDDCPCLDCFYPSQKCRDNCHTQFTPCPLYKNEEIVEQPADLTTLNANLASGAVSFIKSSAASGSPFFLYFPFQHIHWPQFAGQQFRNSSIGGEFGDSIREIDWAVGEVFQALRDSGSDVYYNTFILLTSDNGPDLKWGPDGGSAGLLRCGKGTTWEGGMRAPAIAWWPDKIKVGRTRRLASTLDVLPTLFNMAGATIPQDRIMDGVDMAPILFNKQASEREMFVYFDEWAEESLGPHAIRWRQYKAHFYTEGGTAPSDYPDYACRNTTGIAKHRPPILYNLWLDPSETNPLDPVKYESTIETIMQVKKEFLTTLDWYTPQTKVGRNDTFMPCASPGCEPFPRCCSTHSSKLRTNTLL